MKFNLGLFIFAIILIIGGVAFVYWKLLDDPVKRFHKFAIADANEVRNHTIPNETYYIAAYGASTECGKTTTYLLDDYILNPTSPCTSPSENTAIFCSALSAATPLR